MKNIFPIIVILFYPFTLLAQGQLDVFFDFNKFELNETSKQKLVEWMDANPDIEVSKVYGYCDWIGTNTYNDTLSIQRVDEVYKFLLENKIKVLENFKIKGFGEDFKQSKVQSENRKVIIFYQKKNSIKPATSDSVKDKSLNDKIKESKVGDVLILQNIYFKNRSPIIVDKSKPVLYELLCILEENPKLKIEIQGHICCQLVGDFEDISTKRAKAVYNFLVQNKINRKRLSYKGYGVTKPIHPIPEKTEQEADENRRVEIMIIEN